MKIVFLRSYDFPIGGAPQNRLLGICRGLIEQGFEVEVHQFAPAKLNIPENLVKFQVYKSVYIYNHATRWSPVKSRVQQFVGIFVGFFGALFAILRSNKKKHIDYLFLNSEKPAYVIPVFLLSRIISAKLGRDLNEYPQPVILKGSIKEKIKFSKLYRCFDLVFIISRALEEYYRPLLRSSVAILYLPVTVDFDRFPEPANNFLNSRTITYCGDLSQEKDGVHTLLKAFKQISNQYPEINLKLIGKNDDNTITKTLKLIIEDLGVANKVEITGYIHPSLIPTELNKARLLVLARPNNIQAKGGFPTKIAEYLATGIPVAVTRVGELQYYLYDGVNAFIAEPDCPESFADAITRALSNDKLSYQIGNAGRQVAHQHFSHVEQGKTIANFLNQLT